MQKDQPGRHQDEKKRFVGQPPPAIQKSEPELVHRPVARFFLDLHANTRVLDTRFSWIAQSNSADRNFPRSTDWRGVFFACKTSPSGFLIGKPNQKDAPKI